MKSIPATPTAIFPDEAILSAVWREWSWTHTKTPFYVEGPLKRGFYMDLLFYHEWKPIWQTATSKLPFCEKNQKQSGQSLIFQPATGKSAIPQTTVRARGSKRYLPSTEELRLKLEDWAREVGDE